MKSAKEPKEGTTKKNDEEKAKQILMKKRVNKGEWIRKCLNKITKKIKQIKKLLKKRKKNGKKEAKEIENEDKEKF